MIRKVWYICRTEPKMKNSRLFNKLFQWTKRCRHFAAAPAPAKKGRFRMALASSTLLLSTYNSVNIESKAKTHTVYDAASAGGTAVSINKLRRGIEDKKEAGIKYCPIPTGVCPIYFCQLERGQKYFCEK